MTEITVNGKELPKCALGTWGWGKGINGAGMVFGTKTDEEQLSATYAEAIDSGITLFDTAAVYGMGTSETILGGLIKGNDDIIISTKYTPSKSDAPEKLGASLDASLSRLGRAYADILWLHSPVNIEQNMTEMAKLIKQGKIKAAGLSNANLAEIKLARSVLVKHGCTLFGVQNHYSLLYRGSEQTGILDWCKENSAAFFAYMVLEQGALTGVEKLPAFSRRGMAFSKKRIAQLSPLTNELKSLAEKYNVKPAQIAIAHAAAKGMVPIIGATKPYQAGELAAAVNIRLDSDEVKRLETIAEQTGVSVKAAWEKEITNDR